MIIAVMIIYDFPGQFHLIKGHDNYHDCFLRP